MTNDHASNGALLISYLGAVASWFTQSHVLGLLTAAFTIVNIAIGVVRLRRMLKDDKS